MKLRINSSISSTILKKKSLVVKRTESPLVSLERIQLVQRVANSSIRQVLLMRLLELVYVVLVTKRFRCTASDTFGAVNTLRILGRVERVHLRPKCYYLDYRHTTHLVLELAAHLKTQKKRLKF